MHGASISSNAWYYGTWYILLYRTLPRETTLQCKRIVFALGTGYSSGCANAIGSSKSLRAPIRSLCTSAVATTIHSLPRSSCVTRSPGTFATPFGPHHGPGGHQMHTTVRAGLIMYGYPLCSHGASEL